MAFGEPGRDLEDGWSVLDLLLVDAQTQPQAGDDAADAAWCITELRTSHSIIDVSLKKRSRP